MRDHFHTLWQEQGAVDFIRLNYGDERSWGETAGAAGAYKSVLSLGVPVTKVYLEESTSRASKSRTHQHTAQELYRGR